MNLAEYEAKIKVWKELYGTPPPTPYDPSKVTSHCKKCGRHRNSMSRHHKASDFLFARMRPDLYAYRYMQFHPDDTDKLCNGCHKRWHEKIQPLIDNILAQSTNFEKPTQIWCEAQKKRILMVYDAWINQPLSKRSNENGKRKEKRDRRKYKKVRRSSNASKRS